MAAWHGQTCLSVDLSNSPVRQKDTDKRVCRCHPPRPYWDRLLVAHADMEQVATSGFSQRRSLAVDGGQEFLGGGGFEDVTVGAGPVHRLLCLGGVVHGQRDHPGPG